jgi:hypothetical protein
MEINPSTSPEILADRLIGIGYFKYIPDFDFAIARQELVEDLHKGYLGTNWIHDCVTRDKRSYPADNEDLAEGFMGETILLMRDVLSHEGVCIDSVEDDFQEHRYDVVINGRRHLISEDKQLETVFCWVVAIKRLLEIVNELLAKAGSDERLYGMYGGNDGRAIFLTPEMFDFIKRSGLLSEGEMPFPKSAIDAEYFQ